MNHGVFLLFFILCSAQALPKRSITTQSVGVNLHLRADATDKLVELPNARTSGVEPYTSRAGLTHLRFRITDGAEMYSAIMYAGDWQAADQQALQTGQARLVGYWDTYQGKPSFTAKAVFGTQATSQATGQATSGKPQLLKISGAAVHVPSIEKYTSTARKVHVKFNFGVQGKTYQGVVYDGDWNSATLAALRAGKVTLYGHWDSYDGKPSFITEQVTR